MWPLLAIIIDVLAPPSASWVKAAGLQECRFGHGEPPGKHLMSRSEAAELLGVSTDTIKRYAAADLIEDRHIRERVVGVTPRTAVQGSLVAGVRIRW